MKNQKLTSLKEALMELQQRNEQPHLRNMTRVTSVIDDYLKIADAILDMAKELDEEAFKKVSSFIASQKEEADWCVNIASYPEMLSIAKRHTIDIINKTIALIDELNT